MLFEVLLLDDARTFIAKLPIKLKAKTLRTIALLVHFGSALPMPHSRKLTGHDLWELPVRFAGDICRLFYFHYRGGSLCGYVRLREEDRPHQSDRNR